MFLFLKFGIFNGFIGLAYSFLLFYISTFTLYILRHILEGKLK